MIRQAIRFASRKLEAVLIRTHLLRPSYTATDSELRKIDSLEIPDAIDEIRMFMVVRNELPRLPYVFQYYTRKGVDRFFVVDNGSTDGTTFFLLSQKNTHVFWTKESYGAANLGQKWMNSLLYKYGAGHWCMVGDADELFIYPHYEDLSLRDLARYMDRNATTVMNTLVLDMYSDKPIRLTEFKTGKDPLDTCPCFDSEGYNRLMKPDRSLSDMRRCWGGIRKRIFGLKVCLNKAPFIKFHNHFIFEKTCHYVKGGKATEIEGITFHFKFFSDFFEKVIEEAKREEHWLAAIEYKRYAEVILKNKDLNLYYPGSVKLKDSNQLAELKMLKTSDSFEAYVKGMRNFETVQRT